VLSIAVLLVTAPEVASTSRSATQNRLYDQRLNRL